MRVALLGGGSCFAVNLATHLVGRGDEVLAISRSAMRPPAFTLGLENDSLYRYQRGHLVAGLHRVMTALDEFRPELIVNFAALCEVGNSWLYPIDYYETNVMSLVRLCEELRQRSWFKRFVQVGSSEVYGSVLGPAKEESPIKPSSPYAASKAVFDFHLHSIAKHQAFNAVIAMPSNGYCEGQTLNRIIPKAILAALTGKKLALQGGGAARKSYLHGDDISRAILLVAEKGVMGETYNCGPAEPVSIRDLVAAIAERFGKALDDIADVAPERTGQDSQYWLDSSKIRSLGWYEQVGLDDGLQRMIEWVKRHPELVTMDQTYKHAA